MKKNSFKRSGISGFTLIEIMVVVVILAIAMMAAIPLMSSAGVVQVQSAASMLAADMEYARSMAISRQRYYGVTFNTGTECYQVVDQNGTVIQHPVKVGTNYEMKFPSSSMSSVDIASASFDGTATVKFNYIGAPYNGSGGPLNLGTVSLSGGGQTITITVEPNTGYIRVQ